MTQSREVLAMMDAHTTTFGRKRGCTVSPCGAFLLGAAFLISLVVTGLLVYHLAPCLEEKLDKSCNNASNSVSSRAFPTDTFGKKKLDVRLPRSIVPVSYELRLVPFIQVGNFTFNGEVTWNISLFVSVSWERNERMTLRGDNCHNLSWTWLNLTSVKIKKYFWTVVTSCQRMNHHRMRAILPFETLFHLSRYYFQR